MAEVEPRGAIHDMPAGFTLVETLVSLAIMGLVLGISILALPAIQRAPSSDQSSRAEAARLAAVRDGEAKVITIDSARIRFLPDGRAIGKGVDPLTSEVARARP